MLTAKQLNDMIPGNDRDTVERWHEAIIAKLPVYEINTKSRVAHFISQCAHESNNFRSLTENLNYSEKALGAVFGRYFGDAPKANAAEYARNPEMIANRVYNDEFRRYKMGNTQEGDGWRFRGRGLKQLTGRDNYTRFGSSVNMSAEEAAEYVSTPSGAIESACWFWSINMLNEIADTGDVRMMTRKINGGAIGLEDRQKRYVNAMSVLGEDVGRDHRMIDEDDEFEIKHNSVLRRGSRGQGVKMMQEALGLGASPDGIFGRGTEMALKTWQEDNGLVADGIAGPATLEKLLG
mgnify:CR=1 FL=1